MMTNGDRSRENSKIGETRRIDDVLRSIFNTVSMGCNIVFTWIDYHLNRANAQGNPLTSLILGTCALLIMVIGPTWSLDVRIWTGDFLLERIVGCVVLTAGIAILCVSHMRLKGLRYYVAHCLVIMFTAIYISVLPTRYNEASSAPFQHVYAVLVILLLLITLVARALSRRVMKWMLIPGKLGRNHVHHSEDGEKKDNERLVEYSIELSDSLHDKELDLINNGEPPVYTRYSVYNALLSPFIEKLLLTLLFPSMVLISFSGHNMVKWISLVALVFCWLVFSCGLYNSRWDLLIGTLTRWFILGGPKIVSIVVILLGVGKLFEVDYITTVLYGGPIKRLILATYMVFWLYKYWVNRFFYENLMKVFRSDKGHAEETPWIMDIGTIEKQRTDKISLLGDSEFLVEQGNMDTAAPRKRKRKIYMPDRLLDAIAKGKGAIVGEAAREMKNKIHFYFTMLNGFLLFCVILFIGYQLYGKNEKPMVVLTDKGVINAGFDESVADNRRVEKNILLEKLINIGDGENNKALLIAASGGGSRAALYTASLLCGLHQQDLGDNIAMLSAVSGGAAAAAYYAANIEQLKGYCSPEELANSDGKPWQEFYQTMGESYIDEVLAGVIERRIVGREQNGVLLSESFKRHMMKGSTKKEDIGPRLNLTVSDVRDFGLAFNTTITGHPYQESIVLSELYGEEKPTNELYKVHAGGRLVITNLPVNYFPQDGPEYAEDALFKYVVINGRYKAKVDKVEYESVPVFAAAAMSANFLPVFSDAGIEMHRNRDGKSSVDRYWVTDGGAVDNRGILTLLFALRQAVVDIEDPSSLPELHVIVAEASKLSIDYNHQIRGVGGMLGASCHLANQIISFLVEDINTRICDRKGKESKMSKGGKDYLKIHSIEMPYALRMRGGLGTHWKLPSELHVCNPTIVNKKEAKENGVTITRDEVLKIIAQIHTYRSCDTHNDPKALAPSDQKVSSDQKVIGWICNDEHDFHPRHWNDLILSLK